MKWILGLGAAALAIVLLVFGLGYLLPAQPQDSGTIVLKQPPEAVFTVLSDVQEMPAWDRKVRKIELLPPVDGKPAAKLTLDDGVTMTMVTAESLAPTHLLREFRSDGRLAGSWTYEITPTGDGSEVVLTEKSAGKRPRGRFLSRLTGPAKRINQHLDDLRRHFSKKG